LIIFVFSNNNRETLGRVGTRLSLFYLYNKLLNNMTKSKDNKTFSKVQLYLNSVNKM